MNPPLRPHRYVALQENKGYEVSQDCKERKAPLVLLGVTELMAVLVLMAWTGVVVLLGLMVHAVQRAHRGLPGRRGPLVRRVPPGYRVRPGSRAHRGRAQGRPVQWDLLEWKDHQVPPADRGTTSK